VFTLQQKKIWLPLLTSVGIGAVAFYSMTKNNKGIGQTLSQMAPFIPMKNQSSQQSTTEAEHTLQ